MVSGRTWHKGECFWEVGLPSLHSWPQLPNGPAFVCWCGKGYRGVIGLDWEWIRKILDFHLACSGLEEISEPLLKCLEKWGCFRRPAAHTS